MKLSHCAAVLLVAFAATGVLAESGARKSFDAMKSLSGDWQGKTAQGRAVDVTYRMTANDSALMSEIKSEDDMITMFHLDNDRLLMTHYCGAGNQPRMQGARSTDGKTITFDFLDATNLASPEAGHMHHLVIQLVDADHHTEAWSYVDHGKEMTEMFALQRKK